MDATRRRVCSGSQEIKADLETKQEPSFDNSLTLVSAQAQERPAALARALALAKAQPQGRKAAQARALGGCAHR